MIIPNSYIRLEYDPSTDILIAEMPVFKHYVVSEIKFILSQVISSVKHYNVRFLITDTKDKILDLPDSTYKEIIYWFAQEISTTNLRKLGRLTDAEYAKEDAVQEIILLTGLSVLVKNFHSKEECLEWLLEKKEDAFLSEGS